MKRILFLILFILSCTAEQEIDVGSYGNYYFKNNISIESEDDIFLFVQDYLEYKSEEKNYWQTPEESFQLKAGDCDDHAIFEMYLLKEKLGVESEMVVINGQDGLHCVVLVDGKYRDSTNCQKIFFNPDIHMVIPYGEVMWMAFYYHDSVGKYSH